MRYFSIYRDFKLLLCIDLYKPDRLDVIDAIYFIETYDLDGFRSNYKNIMTAEFKRTGDHPDRLKSRLIYLSDVPQRLSPTDAIALLEGLLQRGKDKKKRQMHPNSLRNLQPTAKFTRESRPAKPRLLDEQQLSKALELRDNGCSWRKVGDLLKCNVSTVRTALRRRGSDTQNQTEKSS